MCVEIMPSTNITCSRMQIRALLAIAHDMCYEANNIYISVQLMVMVKR